MSDTLPSDEEFQRSSTCAASACLEVAREGDRVYIRNSEHPDEQIICSKQEFQAFKQGIKSGDFNRI
jgi:hypothetical protein